MFLKSKQALLGLTMLAAFGMSAQVSPTWTKKLETGVIWQKVYSTGNFIVSTYNDFMLVDQLTGNPIWSNPNFSRTEAAAVKEVTGSSLLEINKDGSTFLLDPFSGAEKFDSKKAGINKIRYKKFLGLSECLLIAGEDTGENQKVLGIDIATGEILWTLEEKFDKIIALNEINPNEFLMVTIFDSYRIKSKEGNIVWKNKNSKDAEKLDKMGGFGALVKEVATAKAKEMDFKIDFYHNPDKNMFIVGGENEQKTTDSQGKEIIKYTSTFQGFDIASGDRIWEKPLETKGQLSDLAFYENNIILLPDNANMTKLNSYELKSNKGSWGKKGRGIKVSGGVYDHFFTEQGLLVISKKGNKNLMTLLDPSTGVAKFKKPIKISGEVVQTYAVGDRLMYITTSGLNILDPATGSLAFSKSIYTSAELTVQKGDDLVIFDKGTGIVKSISLKDGTIKDLSSESVSFKGKESVANIELREDGIFLSSDQNVALINKEGFVQFNKFYVAPKVSGLKQALLYAQAARAAYVGVRSYQAANAFNDASQDLKGKNKAFSDGFGQVGDAYEEHGDAASDFAKQSLKQAAQRFKASKGGRDFVIILGKAEKGNALLKVSKTTGEVLQEVSLGREKKPNYAVDEVTGNIFLNTKPKVLEGYKL